MDKLNVILIGVLVLMFAAAGVNAYAGYSGNEVFAEHYMTQQEWSDSSCGGCHIGMYDEVSESYHVQQDLAPWTSIMEHGVDAGSLEGEDLATTYGQVHPGGGYMADYGLDIDCMICHEQNGLYDYHERSEVISAGNFGMATNAALDDARTHAQQDSIYVLSYMLDVLTPLPIVTEIHDDVNGAPRQELCANCHISEVSTTAVTWTSPEHGQYDVHADVNCYECHVTEDHQIGRKYLLNAPDNMHDAFEGEIRSCDSSGCHEGISHGAMVDGHLETVSCESCHIPALPGGEISDETPISGFSWANGIMETVTHDSQFTPVLAWYNGTYYDQLPRNDSMDSENAILRPYNVITGIWWDEGTDPAVFADPNASSAVGDPILPAHVQRADEDNDGSVTVEEMRSFDADGDGEADYPNAVLRHVEMYFPVSHNVAGSTVGLAEPLACADCHGITATEIDWQALGYQTDPAGADGDFTGNEISVSIPDQRPTEVEREPAF
ncbi:methanogenesis multiheme c-type cytochrome [Methanolobus halotolerans]|uniref:Methanogenesis multiheme c-type cytochrome n=1 Tax=Methanolobus halotolerans TaxID=2052935 RepID=A0A4E0QAU0_9EURY|nr:methanogenesis multiheme c-type cytochrome [Methanolobus halotolerans]TGC09664.1 methanogenesis multiheme c-type cytochrome [Methanolobus halotolerans]